MTNLIVHHDTDRNECYIYQVINGGVQGPRYELMSPHLHSRECYDLTDFLKILSEHPNAQVTVLPVQTEQGRVLDS